MIRRASSPGHLPPSRRAKRARREAAPALPASRPGPNDCAFSMIELKAMAKRQQADRDRPVILPPIKPQSRIGRLETVTAQAFDVQQRQAEIYRADTLQRIERLTEMTAKAVEAANKRNRANSEAVLVAVGQVMARLADRVAKLEEMARPTDGE